MDKAYYTTIGMDVSDRKTQGAHLHLLKDFPSLLICRIPELPAGIVPTCSPDPHFAGSPGMISTRAPSARPCRRGSKSRRTRKSALVRQSGRGLPRGNQPALPLPAPLGTFFDLDHAIESSTSSSHSSLNLRKFSVSSFTRR